MKIEEIRADRLDSGGTTIAIEKLAGKSMPGSGVVDKLYREIAAILRMPDVRGQLEGMGLEIVASSPSEFSAYIDSESKNTPRSREVPYELAVRTTQTGNVEPIDLVEYQVRRLISTARSESEHSATWRVHLVTATTP